MYEVQIWQIVWIRLQILGKDTLFFMIWSFFLKLCLFEN